MGVSRSGVKSVGSGVELGVGVRELVVRGVRELGVSWKSESGIQAWVGVSVWEGGM